MSPSASGCSGKVDAGFPIRTCAKCRCRHGPAACNLSEEGESLLTVHDQVLGNRGYPPGRGIDSLGQNGRYSWTAMGIPPKRNAGLLYLLPSRACMKLKVHCAANTERRS